MPPTPPVEPLTPPPAQLPPAPPASADTRVVFTAGEPPTVLTRMIGEDANTFELHVLAVLLRNPAFVDQVAAVLCVDACPEQTRYPSNEPWNDFTTQAINALYTCVLRHREIRDKGRNGMSRDFAEIILKQVSMDPRGPIDPSEIEAALAVFDQAMGLDINEATQIVRLGFIYWLRRRRMTRVMNGQTSRSSWDPAKLTELLAVHKKVIDQLLVLDQEAFVAFDQVQEPPPVDLIPSALRACDLSLGGGFGRREFSLIIAPSGGGKTAFATQLAASFGLQGHKVLFITTEQPPSELLPRIASNRCGILFEKVRQGIQRDNLTAKEYERYEKLRASLARNLYFADWSRDRSRSIRANLQAEIDRFIAANQRLDVLLFDWIGGALGARTGGDQHALRLAFQDTGDALADMAREFGAVVIGFGQAAIGTTRCKKKIDQDDIAECKSLGRAATNVIGISALREETDDDGPNYAKVQYLFVSKARKSAGGCHRFRRDFEFQRLADI